MYLVDAHPATRFPPTNTNVRSQGYHTQRDGANRHSRIRLWIGSGWFARGESSPSTTFLPASQHRLASSGQSVHAICPRRLDPATRNVHDPASLRNTWYAAQRLWNSKWNFSQSISFCRRISKQEPRKRKSSKRLLPASFESKHAGHLGRKVSNWPFRDECRH